MPSKPQIITSDLQLAPTRFGSTYHLSVASPSCNKPPFLPISRLPALHTPYDTIYPLGSFQGPFLYGARID